MHLYEIRIEKNLGTTAQKSLKTIQIDENLGTIKPALKSFQKTFKTGYNSCSATKKKHFNPSNCSCYFFVNYSCWRAYMTSISLHNTIP